MNDMNKISIYNKVAAVTNSSPKLGEQLKRMAAFIFALSAFTLITSCTEDDLVTQTTPLAPQGMKTVTVDFQLPDEKPALHEEGQSRTATGWADGDELLMKVTVKGVDDTDGPVYESYMMLAYDDSDDRWDMLAGKNTTVLKVASSFVAIPDYVMLAQTTDIDLTQPLSIKVPEDMTQNEAIVSVTYAPELEWDITPDANGAVTDVNRKLKATATTTAPECWEVSSGAWTINQARLRVHTGAAGDVVTITSENFYPNSIGKSADGIYTATTDADGDAYFYGKAGTIDESDNPIALTSGFNLSLTAVTMRDGDAAFTCPIAPVTLLEASNLVPVQLEAGKSYCLDATEKRTEVPSTITEIDGTCGKFSTGTDEDVATMKANIEQLLADGKTTLVVTGEVLAPYSNENIEDEAETVVGEAIRQLAPNGDETINGTINLILADATEIGKNAFQNCTALKSVSAPKELTIIGEGAFFKCDALTSVSLPAATSIGDAAFYGCVALKSVSLPAAEKIGDYAFQACTALKSVELPAAETIGDAAFQACTALTSLTFGEVITSVGTNAFFGVPETCALTLNIGQLRSTVTLKPSDNKWAGKNWASISYVDDEGNAVERN